MIFCVEMQGYPLKFHTKYLSHILKDVYFIQMWISKNSWFKSSSVFLKRLPELSVAHASSLSDTTEDNTRYGVMCSSVDGIFPRLASPEVNITTNDSCAEIIFGCLRCNDTLLAIRFQNKNGTINGTVTTVSTTAMPSSVIFRLHEGVYSVIFEVLGDASGFYIQATALNNSCIMCKLIINVYIRELYHHWFI